MADLAPILALPSPQSFIRKPAANQLRPIEGRGGGAIASGATNSQADAADDAAAQAKRFRFRVHDGAARNTQSSDIQQEQAQTASNRQRIGVDAARGAAAAQNRDATAEPKAIATFLAQLISQEQLGQGLHAPPTRTADLAYRRAGGEPRLDIGSPARFSLAV